ISHDTALVGEEVTVTVSCDNEFLFNSFIHHLAIDGSVLSYAVPFFTPSGRLSGSPYTYWNGPQDIIIYDNKPDGFGTSADDGLEFYELHFTVIQNSDDIASAVWFTSLPEVTALDCDQELHNFNPPAVSADDGSVTVPPYDAVIDFGEVEWNNQSTCTFTVPVLLQSNYPINNLRLAIGFTDNDGNPLTFDDVESSYAITGNESYCVTTGLPYALVTPNGAFSIPPSEDFDTVAHLRFYNDAASPDEFDYTVDLLEYGCGQDYRTFVESPGYQQSLRYYLSDAQLDSDTGGIVISDPYTSVSVPGCQSETCKFPPDCEWWAYSGVYVTSNQDLDSIWVDLDWNTDRYCVTLQDVNPDMYYSGGATSGYAMRVDNVTAGPTRHYATVKVTNGKYTDQWGSFVVSNTSAYESCTHGSTASSGSGGGIFTFALPLQYASCIPNDPIQKPATVPRAYELLQNHPNPFNAGTMIDFTLSDESHVRMEIFNIMGQRVRTLVDDVLPAGEHSIEWNGRTADGREVATGVYLYRMDAGPYTQTRKMVLLK
ncbi:MAG: T9SS type A sorting domain-containing protein, partial [candidate division Zixibacteria bacterium]|nr:T9SS type A sorting domain-containing protein [candidate division Zixibacteria bacterium]